LEILKNSSLEQQQALNELHAVCTSMQTYARTQYGFSLC
jgi:hypothetical protein